MGRISTLAPRLKILDTRTARPAPKRADAELLTAAHRGWADEVKKRAGFRCEDCGATGVKLYADHVKERRDGGAPLDPTNGRCRCGSCHGRKTARERAARMAR